MCDEVLLEAQNICYSYDDDDDFNALQDVSLKIGRGEKIAILGNNGAGKSTFFLICNGILKPQSGKIYYENKEITHKKSDIIHLRRNVGIVFQDADTQIIAPTVKAEISFGPMNLKLAHDEVARRTHSAIAEMDLSGFEMRAPHNLSGGEKKRVTIADIIAMEPSVILLDEPTSSLDPQGVCSLQKTLNTLSARNITLAISTHDIDFAWGWAERIIVFCGGKIIADGAPEEIFADTEIICKAGLRKPILYSAAEVINKNASRLPKDISEFEAFVKGELS